MVHRMRYKKYICFLLALMQVCAMVFPATPFGLAETVRLPGDVDGDGVVDAGDLSLLSGHVARIVPITDEETLTVADVNGDGILSAADMTALAALIKDSQDALSITDVSVNQKTGEAGSVFAWTAEAQGGTGTVEYAFRLVDCGADRRSAEADTVIVQQEFSTSNAFHVRIMDPGDYAVTVTCRDEEGMEYTLAQQAQVTVQTSQLQIYGVNSGNVGAVFAGETLNWFAQIAGGSAPYYFNYILLRDGVQIHNSQSGEMTYAYVAEFPGVYTLEVICTDGDGNKVSAVSNGIAVMPIPLEPDGIPAPVTVNPAYTLGKTANEAQYIPAEELCFSWSPIENAASYEVVLEAQVAEGWTEVLCASVFDTAYTVQPEVIAHWNGKTLFRMRMIAQGEISSEESISYFYSYGQKTAVLIDNQSQVKWNISNAEATSKSFAVSSAVPWTVSSNVDWITISMEEGGILAQVSQNGDTERSGVITVSDGENTATVQVTQGVGNGAPELYYPAYSQDAAQPTDIPVGGMILGFDPKGANYVCVRILEKSADGQLAEVYRGFSPRKEEYLQVVTDYAFRVNTDYVVELTGCCGEEMENDASKNFYYVRMTDKQHRILLDGSPVYTTEAFSDFSLNLYSSGAWTYTSDAQWLCPEAYTDVSYKKDMQTVDILLQPNETYDTRTGTITFRCGDAVATLTVTQKSCLPHFIMPANISKDQNNPSILPSKGFVEKAIYQSGSYAMYENGAWGEENSWGSSSDIEEWTTLYPDDYFKTGVLYRFTMHAGENTAVYYVEFSDSVRFPYAVTRLGYDDYVDLNLSFTASENEEEVKLSTSGAWSITSDSAWLTVSAASGTASASKKTVTISAGKNVTGKIRTGVLTIRSENQICATVTVTQEAQDYLMLFLKDDDSDYILYDPDTSFKHLDGSKSTVDFKVQSPLSHTVTSSDSWITCSKSRLTLDANTTGKRRTGTVIISSGTAQEIITVTQEARLTVPTLVTPALSNKESSPSVVKNDDVELVFNSVAGAVKYSVAVLPADSSLLLPGSHFYSFRTEIQANGEGTFSCRIPRSAFSVDAENCDDITVIVYDAFGYSVSGRYYVKTTSTGAALINGSAAPVWDNATDIAVSEVFTVRSTDPWKAASQASWIHLDKTGGNDGETLTLTLDANSGPARSGQVRITVGSKETILTVNQCAWMPEFPSITAPVFSDDSAMPTVISDGITSLRVTWDYEPQAEYYKVYLLSFKSNSVQHVEASSPKLNTGEFTFENLILEPGQRYSVKITRKSHWGYTAKSYFFTLSDENAFVLVEDRTALDVEMEGDEDACAVTVTSSGVWSASVSDSWILVDNERIKQEDMDLNGYLPEDFKDYSGLSGENLYISVLPNTTDTFRYGTVTVRCGSAESVITVIQEPHYTMADIYSPQLADTRQSSSALPYGSVTLRWAGASGGTGKYRLIVYERDEEKEYRYYEIAEIDNITSSYYTLPKSMLTEGQYYKIWLGTEIKGTDDPPGRWYYFRVGYKNELVVNVSADWSSVGRNGFVTVSASASGGAGEYRFSYELLRNGQQVGITELDDWDYYTFNIKETGNYQVRVYVRDGAGQGTNAISGVYAVGTAEVAQLELSQTQWQPDVSGSSTTVTVDAYDTWRITQKPDWILCSGLEGTSGTGVTLTAQANTGGERSGYVTFSGGGKTAIVFVQQAGNRLAEPTVVSPAAGAALDLRDLTATWNSVSGAGYYIFRMRDLTTGELLIHETHLTETNYTVPAGYFVNGHAYRIAVGAARSGEDPASGSIAWAEREFSISAAAGGVTTISGAVTDSLGNPLQGALIRVYEIDSDGYSLKLMELTTDANGHWEAAGLKRGGTYGFAVSMSGYVFASKTITVHATESRHENNVFRADNHREPTVVYPDVMDFGNEATSDPLYIDISGSWTAKADAAWIHLSVSSGTGSTEVAVTVDENLGEEPREGIIRITDGKGRTHTVEVFQEEAVTEIHVAYKAGAVESVDSIFDKNGKYTGAVLTSGKPYTFSGEKKYVINKDMDIPYGTSLRFEGNVVIKATVNFKSNSKIECTGNLTIASKGVINMYEGGIIRVVQDFIFEPREKHDLELHKGTIQVGGNLDIKKNFYAGEKNEIHLFSTGVIHTVDVDDKLGSKNDQIVNALYLDDEGIEKLNIKSGFKCNRFEFERSVVMQRYVIPTDQNGKRHDVFIFDPSTFDYSLSQIESSKTRFGRLNKEQQNQILSNLHVAMIKCIADEHFGSAIYKRIKINEMISYRDATGEVQVFNIKVEGSASNGKLNAGSIIEYSDAKYSVGVLKFLYVEQPADILDAVNEWYAIMKKEQTEKASEQYKSIYKGIVTDMVWGVLGGVTKMENCFDTAAEAEAMLGELADHNRELQEIYRMIGPLE